MANTTYNARFHKCLETSGISNETLESCPTVYISYLRNAHTEEAILDAANTDKLWLAWLDIAKKEDIDPDTAMSSMRLYVAPPDIRDLFMKTQDNDTCSLWERNLEGPYADNWETAAIMTGYLCGNEIMIRIGKHQDGHVTVFYNDREEHVFGSEYTPRNMFHKKQKALLLTLEKPKESEEN